MSVFGRIRGIHVHIKHLHVQKYIQLSRALKQTYNVEWPIRKCVYCQYENKYVVLILSQWEARKCESFLQISHYMTHCLLVLIIMGC